MQQKEFGKFIREKRLTEFPKLSLNKFAIEADIDSAMLSRIERGMQDISYTAIKKLATIFNEKPSQLIAEFELTE